MNRQLWELYKNSDRGKEVIASFLPKVSDDFLNVEKLFSTYESNIEKDYQKLTEQFWLTGLNEEFNHFLPQQVTTIDEMFEHCIENFELLVYFESETNEGEWERYGDPLIKKRDYRSLSAFMNVLSTFLYFNYPAFFKPILHHERFDKIINYCDALGIQLPEIPLRGEMEKRLFYYVGLCKEFNGFQKEYNLSDAEFCACLYDFAQMLIGENESIRELPEPTNVWLTGANKDDFKILESADKMSSHYWACHEDTKPGDIVIIYCLAPHSKIHSVWRAKTNAVISPFSYYYSMIVVTQGIKVSPIAIQELKEDSYFSQLPIVKKNLQGINGVRLSAMDYEQFLGMLKKRGFNVDKLPKLYRSQIIIEQDLKDEKSVEEKLLIPLLAELGFKDKDWSRQVTQKAGRGLKAIPDFVFFPKGESHFQNSPFIIEAKWYMNSANERMKSFKQAYSYARMMQSRIFGLCDKERLVIFQVNSAGFFDLYNPVFEKHWGNLKDPDVFASLKNLIGAEVISKM